MLVHKKSKNLVLRLENPARVTSVIPTAKQFQLKGQTFVAVPHRLEEVRVLRNLNIDAPGPIASYYKWRGVHAPYTHQSHTADFLTLNPFAFCLNDMGTGKTLSVLWAFDYLKEQDLVDIMIVVCPLSTMDRTWGDEIFRNFANMTSVAVHGTAAKRVKCLRGDYSVYIINHDGLKNSEVQTELLELMSRKRAVVVIDELASFRNSKTQRWTAARKICSVAPYVWGLTGTPIPNEPTDAFGQIRLINPNAVGGSFLRFRESVMRKVTEFKWVAQPNALETVYGVMKPAIRYARADCIDLPPTTFVTREAALSPEQEKAYKEMMTDLIANTDAGQITAFNEAAKAMKLVQICCGSAYSMNGDSVDLPFAARISAVAEAIENAGGKVIVFVPFTNALNKVADALRNEYHVEVVNGETTKSERDRIFGAFQTVTRKEVLVANAAAMSHGVTLTAADVVVWFAPITSAEIYAQANARIVRPGQKRPTLIVRLQSTRLEERMYARLEGRISNQERLLDMF